MGSVGDLAGQTAESNPFAGAANFFHRYYISWQHFFVISTHLPRNNQRDVSGEEGGLEVTQLGTGFLFNRYCQFCQLPQLFWSGFSLQEIFSLSPLCQMISSNWESSVADFERSFLYLQMVLVISIFYALFPLQVEPFLKCPPSKVSSRCLPSKAWSQAIVLVLAEAAKAPYQVLSSSPLPWGRLSFPIDKSPWSSFSSKCWSGLLLLQLLLPPPSWRPPPLQQCLQQYHLRCCRS